MTKHDADAAFELAKRIYPILAGHPPEIQGAVLADAVSLLFAGLHPEIRDDAMARWLDLMRDRWPVPAAETGTPSYTPDRDGV